MPSGDISVGEVEQQEDRASRLFCFLVLNHTPFRVYKRSYADSRWFLVFISVGVRLFVNLSDVSDLNTKSGPSLGAIRIFTDSKKVTVIPEFP